jgi:hypothetical protein
MKLVVAAVSGVLALGPLAPLPVRTSSADEYFPAADSGALMWTQDSPETSRPVVYVRLLDGSRVRVNPRGTTAFSVGISGHKAVFLQLTPKIGGLNAFRLYDLARHRYRTLRTNGFATEGAFADGLVLYGWNTQAGSEGIQLRKISTGNDILLDRVSYGWARVGSVNRHFAIWKKCVVTDCGVYLYDVDQRTTVRVPNPAGLSQSAPSALPDGTVYVVEGTTERCPTSEESLVRYGTDGSRTVLATLAPGLLIARTSATVVQGTPTVYFDRGTCRRNGSAGGLDIYKVVDIPQQGYRATRMSS